MHGLIAFHGTGPATTAAASLLLQLGYNKTDTVEYLDLLDSGLLPATAVSTTVDGIARMSLQLVNNGGGGRFFTQGGKAWRVG